jgi:acyl-CoA thioesterase-1
VGSWLVVLVRAVCAVVVGSLLLGLGTSISVAADSTWAVHGPRLQTIRQITTLGDSVPAGAACSCRPFPTLVASGLALRTAPPVASHDDARSGATTSTVLQQLAQNPTVRAHVRASQVVVVEIGANDLGPERRCGTTAACYLRQVPAVSRRLSTIVDRIRSLTAGHQVAVVLLGYWNVWRDGQVAAAIGAAYVRAGAAVTRGLDAAVRSLAQRRAAGYADLWLAFRGSAGRDDTALLAADGDHPNAAGHRAIAGAVQRVLSAALSRVAYPAVSLAALVHGAVGADVATYQEAVRELLVRERRLGSLDPHGITGAFDDQTAAMTAETYRYEAQATGDPSWLTGDTTTPGPGLLVVLGVPQR